MSLPRPPWLDEVGPEGEVVLSTRCRIARNVAGVPFPWRAAEGQRKYAAELALEAAQRSGGILGRAEALSGERVSAEEMARLLEWRYASPDWAHGGPHRWLLAAPSGAVSLLINEEDHLRLQAILPGLQVESVYSVAEQVERELAAVLTFAWNARIGYLTASPANAGTGLRISVMLHLAGLAASETREAVLQAASEVGCSVRGLYGERTEGVGELYQVSNAASYGAEPLHTAERIGAAVRYLVEAERRARRARFGTPEGRRELTAAAQEALDRIFREDAAPRRLLPLVSVLLLAAAERVHCVDLARTAEWVAMAGVAAVERPEEPDVERFEAVRR